MREWTRENLAWVAGIVEGEGCVSSIQETGKRAIRISISIGMTDLDVLESVARILGVGRLTGPYDRSRHGCVKPQWVYTVVGRQAFAVGAALWPWLHRRRRDQFAYAARRWIEAYRLRVDPARRYAEMVAATDGDCLVWLGYIAPSGAGTFSLGNRNRQAHAVLYELEHPGSGAPPSRRACSTRGCVRHWEPILGLSHADRGIRPLPRRRFVDPPDAIPAADDSGDVAEPVKKRRGPNRGGLAPVPVARARATAVGRMAGG